MGTGAVPFEGELLPDAEELQGREPDYPVIPVSVCGPVRAQTMSNVPGIADVCFPSLTEARPLVNEDRTRARLVVWCATAGIFIGFDKAAVESGNCARLAAAAQPLVFEHWGRVWVRSDTATATVSFFTEHWAQ